MLKKYQEVWGSFVKFYRLFRGFYDWMGEEGVGEGTLGGESGISAVFRSPESRSSKTSEFTCIQPDGSGCNSPVQRAKHTPFFAIREWQKILDY